MMKHLLLVCVLVFVVSFSVSAQVDDWNRVDEIAKAIKLPNIPNRDFVITDFGQNPARRMMPARRF